MNSSPRSSATIRAVRVLVVEPRPMSAPMLRRWLERRGHALDAANDPDSGFAQAVAAGPDAVLIDLALGASTVSTLTDRLRTHPVTRSASLVSVGEPTAMNGAADRPRFERRVLKPIDVDELGAVLLEAAS